MGESWREEIINNAVSAYMEKRRATTQDEGESSSTNKKCSLDDMLEIMENSSSNDDSDFELDLDDIVL